MPSPDHIRRTVRARRREIPPPQRRRAARELAHRVSTLKLFSTAHHVAGYLAVDGEMDPAPLLERAWAMSKSVYLPVLTGQPQAHMLFAPYGPDSTLKPNRFGIPEPVVPHEAVLPPQRLDLVLAPLVAFDEHGSRIGMGGGFYDRTFAFLANPDHLRKPRLLGLAYELQRYPELERQDWDVPLDGIATEAGLYSCGVGWTSD